MKIVLDIRIGVIKRIKINIIVVKNKREVKIDQTRQRPTFPQVKPAVLSAMRGLASGFGMEPGVSLSL